MLWSKEARYTPEAHARYRNHLRSALRFGALWFGGGGVVLALAVLLLERGVVFAWIAAIVTAVLAVSAVVGAFRLLDFAFPNLMPYFSAPVPGPGLTIGFRLLRHSRALDGLAESVGLRRIGSFVSDDDLFDGSGPTWHSAAEALAVFGGLLERFGAHASVQAAKPDLEKIRDRLRFAAGQGIGFCLLLRDVHGTNAREWGLRKGHP